MTKTMLLGAGAALALSFAAATTASAQDLAPPNLSSGSSPAAESGRFDDSVAERNCAPAMQVRNATGIYVGCRTGAESSAGPGQSLERFVLVRGRRDQLVRPDPENAGRFVPVSWDEPAPARFNGVDDEHTVFSEAEWRSLGWSQETFDRLQGTGVRLCQRTGVRILTYTRLAGRFAGFIPRAQDLRVRYEGMESRIESAGNKRTGGNVFSSIFSIFTGTAAYVIPGAIGNEAQGEVWEDMTQITREAGELGSDFYEASAEFNITSLEDYVDYHEMIADYCITAYA